MACALVAQTSTGCQKGGFLVVAGIPLVDITAATVAGGILTGVTLAVGKSWTKYTPDDEDDIALIEILQDEARGKHKARVLLSMDGADKNKLDIAEAFDGCCGMLFLVQTNNTSFAIGYVKASDTSFAIATGKAKARTSILIGTAADDSRAEIEIVSSDLRVPLTTSIDIAAL